MASLNQCNFIGRVGKTPETRFTPGGNQVTNCSIAVTEKYKDKETTVWVDLIFWGKLAEIVSEYVDKGALIYVSGRLQIRPWEDKDGHKRTSTEIVVEKMQMLSGKGEKREPQGSNEPQFDPDSEIPF